MTTQLTPEIIASEKIYLEWGLTESEYDYIKQRLGRLPNETETGLFSVMWSEHCSYKNSKNVLRKFPSEGKQVLQGPGEGAGIVDIGDNQAVVFKAESHNHPSAVEPYEGAATGVGGIIRDIFSMGARPVAFLDSLRFGELDNARTQYLVDGVVSGIAGYGNCVGVPTIGGEVAFDPCYEGNPLVNVMCVGLIDHEAIQAGKAQGTGNSIIYVGAKTGRDGIHGATFASKEFNEEHESQRSAVQVGDPFMGKLLMEACIELVNEYRDVLIGIQDMGAAGLVSSSSEMASKAGSGLKLDLDNVPQREENMTPYEMMLSESQERMLLCVKKGEEQQIFDLFEKYGLDAVNIGEVTNDGMYRLYHHGELVADVPVASLTDEVPNYQPEREKPARLTAFEKMEDFVPQNIQGKKILEELLQQPTIASKKSLYHTYDSQVRTSTVVGPGSDAAVLRVRGTNKALAMTTDCNARYLYLNPEIGGQIAVSEAARNIVCSGGKPLAITDCLNYGNPENPEIYWELWHSADGIAKACKELDTPVISGNVSLYNEFNGEAIYPTPMIGMVGLIEKTEHVTTQEFKEEGHSIYLVGETTSAFNGSELQKMLLGKIEGKLPDFDLATEKEHQDLVLTAIKKGLIASAHDLSEGGLGVALAESLFGTNQLGAKIIVDMDSSLLFSETQSRFLLSVAPEKEAEFNTLFGSKASKLGEVTTSDQLEITTNNEVISAEVAHLNKLWEEAISCLMKKKA